MFEIILTKEARKDYQKLSKSMVKHINQCLDHLRQNPLHYPQAVSLIGNLAGYYRWRVGDWRVFYEVNEDKNVVTVLQIAHRSKVYK